MSLAVTVREIKSVTDHPDAHSLSLNQIDGFTAISNKIDGQHRYKPGQWVVYIPEDAIVPDWLLKHMGFWDQEKNEGTLSGSKKNRVKAVKLRGIVSQGIIYPTFNQDDFEKTAEIYVGIPAGDFKDYDVVVQLGEDVANYLGITKYEPTIPTTLSGEVEYKPEFTVKFDIENIQNYPDLFQGHYVIVTEKVHGTFTGLARRGNEYKAFSKGLGAQGLVFTGDTVYTKFLDKFEIPDNHILMGEIFGPIQDLRYGFKEPTFRAFDLYDMTTKAFWAPEYFQQYCDLKNIPTTPILYAGIYDFKYIRDLSEGKTTVGNDKNQIREGVVVRTVANTKFPEIGRGILKSIGTGYKLRKNKDATEFH